MLHAWCLERPSIGARSRTRRARRARTQKPGIRHVILPPHCRLGIRAVAGVAVGWVCVVPGRTAVGRWQAGVVGRQNAGPQVGTCRQARTLKIYTSSLRSGMGGNKAI